MSDYSRGFVAGFTTFLVIILAFVSWGGINSSSFIQKQMVGLDTSGQLDLNGAFTLQSIWLEQTFLYGVVFALIIGEVVLVSKEFLIPWLRTQSESV